MSVIRVPCSVFGRLFRQAGTAMRVGHERRDVHRAAIEYAGWACRLYRQRCRCRPRGCGWRLTRSVRGETLTSRHTGARIGVTSTDPGPETLDLGLGIWAFALSPAGQGQGQGLG